jgi:hypothetical protein
MWICSHPSHVFISSCPPDFILEEINCCSSFSLLTTFDPICPVFGDIVDRITDFWPDQLCFRNIIIPGYTTLYSACLWKVKDILGWHLIPPHTQNTETKCRPSFRLLTTGFPLRWFQKLGGLVLSHKEFIFKMLMASALACGQHQEVWFTNHHGLCILGIPWVMQFWTQIDSRSLIFQEGPKLWAPWMAPLITPCPPPQSAWKG